jgi:hypothetical protein
MATGLSAIAKTTVCLPGLALAIGLGMGLQAAADDMGDDTGLEGPGHRRSAPAPPAAEPPSAGSTEPAPDRSAKGFFEDLWTRDKLTGDWGGLRTKLHDHGVDIGLRLSQYGQWVASGGVDTNGEYGGTMDYRLNADLNKLLGSWEGLAFSVHARTRWGRDINADAGPLVLPNVGLLMPSRRPWPAT